MPATIRNQRRNRTTRPASRFLAGAAIALAAGVALAGISLATDTRPAAAGCNHGEFPTTVLTAKGGPVGPFNEIAGSSLGGIAYDDCPQAKPKPKPKPKPPVEKPPAETEIIDPSESVEDGHISVFAPPGTEHSTTTTHNKPGNNNPDTTTTIAQNTIAIAQQQIQVPIAQQQIQVPIAQQQIQVPIAQQQIQVPIAQQQIQVPIAQQQIQVPIAQQQIQVPIAQQQIQVPIAQQQIQVPIAQQQIQVPIAQQQIQVPIAQQQVQVQQQVQQAIPTPQPAPQAPVNSLTVTCNPGNPATFELTVNPEPPHRP